MYLLDVLLICVKKYKICMHYIETEGIYNNIFDIGVLNR